MGAGKSTIGRLLAKELRLLFKDSDKEIELRTGANIPWIFDKEGEPGFRDREQAMIAELCALDGVVLATGGGAVMRDANRAALFAGGRVIYLHASVEQQVGRTARIATGRCCAPPTRRPPCVPCWRPGTRSTARSPTWW